MSQTIALLHYAGPPGIGGVEATIAAHVRLFADDGYTVRVVVGSGGITDGREDLQVVPLLGSRHPNIDEMNMELNRGVVSSMFEGVVAQLEAQLEDALAGCALALVHNVHTLHKNLAFTAALHRLHTANRAPRLIAWAHDFAWRDPLYQGQLHAGWPWNLLREPWSGVQYVAVSEDRRNMLADLLDVSIDTIKVVPPGVDVARLMKLDGETVKLIEQYALLHADPLLVLPARITRRKNIEAALRIVAALRDEGMAPVLVVTGPPGPHNPSNAAYLAHLQALQRELAAPVLWLYEVFVDHGGRSRPVTDDHVADWLRLADGLLFPSRAEGFGMPIIEAALHGLPIFCSDIAPFREIAGDHVLPFALDEPPTTTARRIATALRGDARYLLRQHVRRHYTWHAIYRRAIAPLLHPTSDPASR